MDSLLQGVMELLVIPSLLNCGCSYKEPIVECRLTQLTDLMSPHDHNHYTAPPPSIHAYR